MENATGISNQISEVHTDLNQYLTFFLGNEEYGMHILEVREIRSWEVPTSVPNLPEYIHGVINLRGNVVPIIDLRKLFSLEAKFGQATAVIIAKPASCTKDKTIGLVVDAVSDVYSITAEKISPPPDLGNKACAGSVQGLIMTNNSMIILLDINSLLNSRILPEIAS
jgi:purine-binding chemotaxis protein CheW